MKTDFTYRQILNAIYVAALCFFTYTCVFAFRKPFTVATFEGEKMFGISYQTSLIISQVIGYMIAKFVGIRFIAALKRSGRWTTGLLVTGCGWFSLLMFAMLPAWAGPVCFMINGFMMGFMWGIVFSYAEGRRATDFIGSALAVSFIFAGGFTRSVGKWLMAEYGVTEKWMPFATGLVFALPMIILFFLLEKAPRPDTSDITEREERISMTRDHRRTIVKGFGTGLVIIGATYTLLTIIRDIRDNYMGNIWAELGYAADTGVFTRSETRISLIILVLMSLIVVIRNNMKAFRVLHILILTGFLLAAVSSYFFLAGKLAGNIWMQCVGLGLYMAYIPFNAIYFDRMIASFRIKGNVGFLIYITDAFGYLGSVLVMISKETLELKLRWSEFYSYGVVVCALAGAAGTIYALAYFNRKYRTAV